MVAQCESLQHSNATASYNHHSSSADTAQLVSSMFQFFIALTYEKRSNVATVLSLSEVVHLAEVLAAGGVDVESVVVPALAPLIIDIYVKRGVRYRPALRLSVLNSPLEHLSDLNEQLARELE